MRKLEPNDAQEVEVLRAVELMGWPIHALTQAECVEAVTSSCCAGSGGWMVTANVDILRQCVSDPMTAELISTADLIVPDGMPLVWASKLAGDPLPERVAGSDLIFSLSERAAELGLSIYLLGGNPGTAEATAEILTAKYPGLKVAGTYCPSFGFQSEPEECSAIESAIASANPDLVYVGLSFPLQGRVICDLRHCAPNAWWLGVGISFSFVSGEVERAPEWMQHTGLEWCYRLKCEPRRLVKRYLAHDLPFSLRLMTSAIRQRMMARRKTQRRTRASAG